MTNRMMQEFFQGIADRHSLGITIEAAVKSHTSLAGGECYLLSVRRKTTGGLELGWQGYWCGNPTRNCINNYDFLYHENGISQRVPFQLR